MIERFGIWEIESSYAFGLTNIPCIYVLSQIHLMLKPEYSWILAKASIHLAVSFVAARLDVIMIVLLWNLASRACQILEWLEKSKPQSRGFETSWYFAVRRLTALWIEAQNIGSRADAWAGWLLVFYEKGFQHPTQYECSKIMQRAVFLKIKSCLLWLISEVLRYLASSHPMFCIKSIQWPEFFLGIAGFKYTTTSPTT